MSTQFADSWRRNLLQRASATFAAIINTISNRSLAGHAGHAGRASHEGVEIFYY